MGPITGVAARRAITLLTAVALVAAAISATDTVVQSQRNPAAAADMSGFNPGNIIDDSRFFNGNVMSASDVQSFLNSKESGCQSGYTCLNSYTESTPTIAANPMCAQYNGAANESAATIIAKVGAACGISQKVILVTLQKEQGIVTSTAPSTSMYLHAMGALCPDSAPCDSAAAGFFNQVYTGAYLFMRYTQPVGTGPGTAYYSQYNLSYPVGQTSNVLYNPNSACGSLAVNIQNQATHVLYVYTPYTPNAAALASSYGVGDGCSSYGNRNFYSYFMDWFGSVRGYDYPIGSYFSSYFAANSSWLGYPSGAMTCGGPDNGCFQNFQNAIGAVSYSTAPAAVRSMFSGTWSNWGQAYGPFGYPTSDQVSDMGNGSYTRQTFQGGWMFSSPYGLQTTWSSTQSLWSNWGREYGPFGWPMQNQSCIGSVCFQPFNGAQFVSASGSVHAVPTSVFSLWGNWGRETGPLGLPVSDPSANPTSGNYTQNFSGGVVTVTNGTAAITSFADPWYNTILQNSSWLGAAASGKSCTLGYNGCYQSYTNGWVVQSAAGTAAISNAFQSTWAAYGREYGPLGFPLSSATSDLQGGYARQQFQGGWILTSPSGTFVLLSSVQAAWSAWGRETGPFGWPVGNQYCSGSTCFQDFTSGVFVSTKGTTQAVPTVVRTLWGNWGREYGPLGLPTSSPSANPTSGNYVQSFSGGTITVTNGNAMITSFTDPWLNTVLTQTWLGSATSNKTCDLGGGACRQSYANGWIVQSSAGTFTVPNAVITAWGNWGREYGPLGLPTSSPSANPTSGNYVQSFSGGTITVTNGNAMITSFTDPWLNTVLTQTWLGSATSNKTCDLGGGACRQSYANGWIVQSSAGTFTVPNAVITAWGNWGREYGPLGLPTSSPSANPTSGNYVQSFSGGTITVTNGNAMITSFTDPWLNTVLTQTWLGSATSNKTCDLGGGACRQSYANGWIVQSSAGTFTVPNAVITAWGNWGREYGPLGLPTSAPSATPSNSGTYTQAFQGGVITVTNGVGTRTR